MVSALPSYDPRPAELPPAEYYATETHEERRRHLSLLTTRLFQAVYGPAGMPTRMHRDDRVWQMIERWESATGARRVLDRFLAGQATTEEVNTTMTGYKEAWEKVWVWWLEHGQP